ncbi:MAG: ferrochelatase [Hyphomonadaceae bacterium]|nr:ferrochelatase [Hyphomonadaceae bacterium]
MTDKTGILLVNLGSPSSPTTKAVRKYLFQFLHDKNVIELTRWLWCPILHGVILRTRPKRSAEAYAKIWRKEADGAFADEAPLVEITRAQAAKLRERLPDYPIEIGMRYGQPSLQHAIERLSGQGCGRIVVLPLYPQYAGATTRSVEQEIAKLVSKDREGAGNGWPEIKILEHYYDDPGYINAIVDSLTSHLGTLDFTPDNVLVSFHGIPVSSVQKGDPYQDHCQATFDLLQAHPDMETVNLKLTFQSRFGPKEWLSPYTLTTLQEMPSQGLKKAVVIAPGFPADCLETLEEIAMEAEEEFYEKGGEKFSVVPCLNDSAAHIDVLQYLIETRLLGSW